jgi:hypothetical protein
LRGLDLNQRPSGYEPDELPGCSTPRIDDSLGVPCGQIANKFQNNRHLVHEPNKITNTAT